MMQFDEFMEELQRLGATNAVYMDMGEERNYSWYRNAADKVVTLFGLPVPWSHNYVIFENKVYTQFIVNVKNISTFTI